VSARCGLPPARQLMHLKGGERKKKKSEGRPSAAGDAVSRGSGQRIH